MTRQTPIIDDQVRALALKLWQYHKLGRKAQPSDFVLALGGHDTRVARHAAKLVLDGLAPVLVTSGGYGKVTTHSWKETEADRFAQIARELGVPDAAILVERFAANTGENLTCTRELLKERGIEVQSGILVCKPYMERRSYATAARQWPEVRWTVTSPPGSFEDYATEDVPERRMIELMVGDLHRIAEYPRLGYQIPQDIPTEVWEAGAELVQLGFDAFALRSESS